MTRLILAILIICIFTISGFSQTISMQECISIALENNPDLAALQNSYESSKYKYWEAKSYFFPQISLNASASRRVSPLSATFGDTASFFPGLPEKTDVTTYSQGISAQQNLWDFGKTWSLVKRTEITKELARLSYEKKKQEIIFNTKKSYYAILEANSLFKITKLNLMDIEKLYESVKLREKEGLATPIDVLNIEAEYVGFQAEVTKAEHFVEISELSFFNTLGKNIEKSYALNEDNFTEPEEYPLGFRDFQACRRKALNTRIDFIEFDLQEKLAETTVSGAFSEWLPALAASGSYERQDNKYPPETEGWSALVSLSVPLFKGGGNYAKLKSAKADLNNIKNNKILVTQNLLLQLKTNYYKVLEAKQTLNVIKKKNTYFKKNFEAIEAKFNEGMATVNELIEAQTKKSSLETEMQNALYGYHVTLNELEYTTGGIK